MQTKQPAGYDEKEKQMKTLKKSSMAIITTLVLGLLPALPAAAQTAPETTAARKYSVQVSQAESGGQDSPMKFTVTQKTGTDNEEVIITLVKDPKAKAEPEKGHAYISTSEYDVTAAKSKAVNVR